MDVMKSAPTNTRFMFFRCTSWTQKMAWKCYYYPINSYQAGGQPCEQTVNHLARINIYNRHWIGLTYQSGITHSHLQDTRYLQYVMHVRRALIRNSCSVLRHNWTGKNCDWEILYLGLQNSIPFRRALKRKNDCIMCRRITELHKWDNNASICESREIRLNERTAELQKTNSFYLF
jgi:hypothetical protein